MADLMKHASLLLGRILVAAILLLAWECTSIVFPKVQFAIARPSQIASEAATLLASGGTYRHVAATGGAALAGLVLGSLLGTLLGLFTWFSRSTAEILQPFALALGAVPILAVAPLMIIWFGIGLEMKVALACLSTVFVAFAQATRGAASVSGQYIDVLRGMKASNRQIFITTIIPGSLNWVFGGMRINAGLALLGTFIGEFIASNMGLGYMVLRAASLYNVPRAMAASLFIVALALVFDAAAGELEKRRKLIIRLFGVPRSAWHSR